MAPDALRQAVQSQIDRDIVRRSVAGGVVNSLLATVIVLTSDLYPGLLHRVLLWLIVASGLMRLALCRYAGPATPYWKKGGLPAWAATFLLMATSWSTISATQIWHSETFEVASLVPMFCILGFCAGLVLSLSAYSRLTLALLAILSLPTALALIATARPGSGWLAGALLLFSLYLAAQVFVVKREYLLAVENAEMLKIRAVELEQASEQARMASAAKGQFLANMSHELRTPMNGVLGMLTLAAQTALSREQRDFVQTAKESAESLLRILNDVLDFSKIDAGRLRLAEEPFDLAKLLRSLEGAFRVALSERGLYWRSDIPEVPVLLGDEGRLRQILVNLVGNALRFTERGGITLSARLLDDRDGCIELEFCVADTGCGIPADQLEKIFIAFEQVDSAEKANTGGTGLGLSISRRLAALMGGRIWAESEMGQGSRFYFTARFAVAPKLCFYESPPPLRHKALRLLVAEDNVVNQRVITGLLERDGHSVTIARNGLEAIAAIDHAAFDAILMDVRMPEMDGIETTRAIRQREATIGGHIPIIALTASAMAEDRTRCLDAGMDYYLAKPVRLEELRTALDRILSPADEEMAEPPEKAIDRSELTPGSPSRT